jgi:hypothetical protein
VLSARVGRAVTPDESVINGLEHSDRNEEGGIQDRFEAALIIGLDSIELKFRATGWEDMVSDLLRPNGRAAKTVNLNMAKLLLLGQEDMKVSGRVCVNLDN